MKKTVDCKIAAKLENPFLKALEKKALGITGYKLLIGWYPEKETDLAWQISSLNETGTAVKKDIQDLSEWIPKSQSIIFEYEDEELLFEGYKGSEALSRIIYVKTWLFNKNKSTFQVNQFKNVVI